VRRCCFYWNIPPLSLWELRPNPGNCWLLPPTFGTREWRWSEFGGEDGSPFTDPDNWWDDMEPGSTVFEVESYECDAKSSLSFLFNATEY
jgi:hypothetical protein